MDIVLNTTFANSTLPTVQYPGFVDAFGDADGPLDYTDDGKAWILASGTGSGVAAFERISGAAKLSAGAPSSNAVVDSGASDGVLTFTVGSVGSPKNLVIVFRYVDRNNYYYITLDNGSGAYRCFKYKDGANADTVFNTAQVSANGDVIAVTLNGTSISATRNGSALGSSTTPQSDFLTSTKHGFGAAATAEPRGTVASIQFVPAE